MRTVLACAVAGILLAFVAAMGVVRRAEHMTQSGGHGEGWCGPLSASRAAGLAPDTCDAVVVIDGPSRLASTEAGRGTLRVLGDLGLFTSTSVAWAELASALGMTPADALDAIAGSRTMLMVRRESAERPAAWALLTEVEPATELLIRKRLKPVPRQIFEGQPVLMLENGRFLLATRRAGRDRGDSPRAAVLVAPADSPVLFESCLPLLSGRSAPAALWADARVSLTLNDEPCDAFAIYRAREDDEPDAVRTLVALSARSEGRGWRAEVACDPALLGDPGSIAGVSIPETLFRAVSEGAVIAFGAPVSDRRESGSAFGRLLFRFFADVAPNFDRSAVLAIRERPGDAGSELIVGACVKPGEEMAAAIDAGMAAMVNRLTRAGSAGAEAHDFSGRFPGAVREASLTARSLSVLTPMIGTSPTIRWCFSGMDGHTAARWWLAHVSESASRADGSVLRAVASSLTPNPDDPDALTACWTTIGIAHPARVLQIMPPVLATVTRSFACLRWVDAIDWRGALAPDGLVRGEAGVQFVPEAEGIGPGPLGDR